MQNEAIDMYGDKSLKYVSIKFMSVAFTSQPFQLPAQFPAGQAATAKMILVLLRSDSGFPDGGILSIVPSRNAYVKGRLSASLLNCGVSQLS